MSNSFFEKILNSSSECPARPWKLDVTGLPTSHILAQRRSAKYAIAIIRAKKQKKERKDIIFKDKEGIPAEGRQCNSALIINFLLADRWHVLSRSRPNVSPTKTDDKKQEAAKNKEAASIWNSDLESAGGKGGLRHNFYLSAAPLFVKGPAYSKGLLFPWPTSDFSLMHGIERGIVKPPRVAVADTIPTTEVPIFRDAWEHIFRDMPKKEKRKIGMLDSLKLPSKPQTAVEARASR